MQLNDVLVSILGLDHANTRTENIFRCGRRLGLLENAKNLLSRTYVHANVQVSTIVCTPTGASIYLPTGVDVVRKIRNNCGH